MSLDVVLAMDAIVLLSLGGVLIGRGSPMWGWAYVVVGALGVALLVGC